MPKGTCLTRTLTVPSQRDVAKPQGEELAQRFSEHERPAAAGGPRTETSWHDGLIGPGPGPGPGLLTHIRHVLDTYLSAVLTHPCWRAPSVSDTRISSRARV